MRSSIKIKRISRIVYDNPIPVFDVINAEPNHSFLIEGESGYLNSHNSALL